MATDESSLKMPEQQSHIIQISIDDESHLRQMTETVEYSKELKDERKMSLLNADFKILTSLENKRFTSIISHTISPSHFVLGKEKRIHHAISLARDTIYLNNMKNKGDAIADLDFKSAFDLLCMEWVLKVL